jgi:glycogen debranching enzyme
MVVAPELFPSKPRAKAALDLAWTLLAGPNGVKTLDPKDSQFRPQYVNHEDTEDYFSSRGFNYHQGPEWLWPMAFMLRARLAMATDLPAEKTAVRSFVRRYSDAIARSPWQGLAELEHAGGAFCAEGCPTQAWTMACLLEVVDELD